MAPLLKVDHLTVAYLHWKQAVPAVRDVSFEIEEGKTLGLVGESGCGKSTLALAMMGLLSPIESRIPHGSIFLKGTDLLQLKSEEVRLLRGKSISMIFQDPFSALNPVMTIEDQIQEVIELDEKKRNRQRASALLEKVQLSDTERILNSYPHQLSGGQRQRVLIAIALCRHPDLLIADEPTTALDVTIQDEIIHLLENLKKELKMSMLFVTHNMGLVKHTTDHLAVMYAGQIVEYGPTEPVLKTPKHPYTQGLLKSQPSLKPGAGPIPVLEGQPPEPSRIPSGCPFHPRCSQLVERCPIEDPTERIHENQSVRCHLY